MKKTILSISFISRYTGSLLLTLMTSHCAIYAAEKASQPKEDSAHDQVLRKLCLHHDVPSKHFTNTADKPIPIFDIKKSLENNHHKIHNEQLRHIRSIAPHLLPTTAETVKKESSYRLGTILVAPIYFAGNILYSPIALGSWAYNSMPSLRTSPKTAQGGQISSTPSFPQKEVEGLVDVDRKSKDGTSISPALSTVPALDALNTSKASAQASLPPANIASVETSTLSTTTRPQIIISLDGGGSKGFMEALWIQYIEDKLKASVGDFATFIGGSSIGGIIGTGLTIKNQNSKPCMSGSDLVNLFSKHFAQIFPSHSSWNVPARIWDGVSSLWYAQYDPQPLENLLQQYVGQTTLSSLYNPNCNLLITSVDSLTNNPYKITSVTHPTVKAWEAARSTSAAPTFFPGFVPSSIVEKVRLIDGGVWENNPAFETYMFAYGQAVSQSQTFNPIMLSLGTGITPSHPLPINAGKINGVSAIVESCIDSQVSGTEMTMSALLKPGATYFRLNPNLPQYVPMDEFDAYKVILTQAAESQYETLDKFIELDAVRLRLEAK